MTKYKSKKGLGVILFLVIILGSSAFLMIKNHIWSGLIIDIAVAAFAGYIFSSTYYLVNENVLIVKSGFLVNMTIKIDGINKIQETNNPLSSPATSLDRLAIYYGDGRFVLISPKEKMAFINQLRAINPKIEVAMKGQRNTDDKA